MAPLEFRFIYPEFLPDPDPLRRNYIREKLERIDMMNRREKVDIPEFYVGSILAVKYSDRHAQGKTNRFVGICILRENCGLRAEFTLRNVIDHQPIEMRINLYDPVVQNIQVVRLEKRLDEDLRYLRDALPKYSTFDPDMEVEILPEGSEVPVNPLQVVMKPKPWDFRWARSGMKGISKLQQSQIKKDRMWLEKFSRPWEKYDLMDEYRKVIPEEEQNEIWTDVYSKLHELEIKRRKMSRKRTFFIPKKSG
ncbi:mitochondrial ribosomal protein L19 isoform X2 [Arctopsyche grandis]